jgi:hypothetical protein
MKRLIVYLNENAVGMLTQDDSGLLVGETGSHTIVPLPAVA